MQSNNRPAYIYVTNHNKKSNLSVCFSCFLQDADYRRSGGESLICKQICVKQQSDNCIDYDLQLGLPHWNRSSAFRFSC